MNITDEEVAWIEAAMNQPNDTYRLVAEVGCVQRGLLP